jgi:ribonuclease P protein component
MPPKRFAFPKSRRLTHSEEFAQVRKIGRAQSGRLLILRVVPEASGESFRAGFVTSRKIGGAVVRNRVRRRLREIVRKHQHQIRAGCWFVTSARANAATADYSELEAEWLRLAGRASILATSC